MTLERWFGALFHKAAADRDAGIESIYVRSASRAAQLLADQQDVRVLHGDIHHRNIRKSSRGWLSFDPKGVVGERAYECANTLCNPVMPELVHNETRLHERKLVVTGHRRDGYRSHGNHERYHPMAPRYRDDYRAASQMNVDQQRGTNKSGTNNNEHNDPSQQTGLG